MHERIVMWGSQELGPVWDLAAFAVGGLDAPVVEVSTRDLTLRHVPDWRPLRLLLERGEIASFNVAQPGLMLLFVNAPAFGESSSSGWQAVLDCSSAVAADIYRRAKLDDRMAFVALSVDDNPSVEALEVSVESFPWGDWSLIVGAVRGPDGEWVERNGPANPSARMI